MRDILSDISDGIEERTVPPMWTADHVMFRLIEAFETLARLPPAGLRRRITSWPTHIYEWADLLAQEETQEAERRRRRFQERPIHIPPSKESIDRMEESIGWAGKYLVDGRAGKIHVVAWAMRRSRSDDRGAKAPIPLVVRQAEIIARGLRRDRVVVR